MEKESGNMGNSCRSACVRHEGPYLDNTEQVQLWYSTKGRRNAVDSMQHIPVLSAAVSKRLSQQKQLQEWNDRKSRCTQNDEDSDCTEYDLDDDSHYVMDDYADNLLIHQTQELQLIAQLDDDDDDDDDWLHPSSGTQSEDSFLLISSPHEQNAATSPQTPDFHIRYWSCPVSQDHQL
eukprot:ANDGO_06921.mRNA.1 hypothetical protein